jgi:hypothetical protein
MSAPWPCPIQPKHLHTDTGLCPKVTGMWTVQPPSSQSELAHDTALLLHAMAEGRTEVRTGPWWRRRTWAYRPLERASE